MCLKGFQEDLLEVHENKDESLLGCFIKLVDYALDKMSEIYDSKYDKDAYIKICSEAKIIVSELMTHAMIIAQISIEENCQMIEGTCLSVSLFFHVKHKLSIHTGLRCFGMDKYRS